MYLSGSAGIGKTQTFISKNCLLNCYKLNTKAFSDTFAYEQYFGQAVGFMDDFKQDDEMNTFIKERC